MARPSSTRSRSAGPTAGESLALALLVGLLALTPVCFWRAGMEGFESSKAALVQLTALALLGLVGGRWLREQSREPITLTVLFGALAAGLSTLLSVSPRTSLQGGHDSHAGLATVLGLLVVFLATRQVCRSGREVRCLLIGVAAGMPIVVVYGLLQVGGYDPLPWDEVSPFAGWVRPLSTLGHPNYLGGYLVMALPLLGWLLAEAWARRYRLAAIWLGWLILCALVLVVATLSRGAWLAGAVAAVVLLFRCRPRNLLLGTSACLVVVVALSVTGRLGVAQPLLQRVGQMGEMASRRCIWETAWCLFLDRPVTGWGIDTFQIVFGRHRSAAYWELEWGRTPTRAHNDLLHTLATQGVLGASAYLALPAVLGWAWWRAWRRRPSQRNLLRGLGASVTAFYVQNLVGFAVLPTATLLAVLVAVLSRLHESEESDGVTEGYSPGMVVGCVAGWVLLGANLFYPDSAWGSQSAVLLILSGAACTVTVLALSRGSQPLPLSWPGVSHVGVAAAVCLTILAWWGVIQPWRASWACRLGEAYQAVDPRIALAWHERAVALAPGHDLFWSRLAAAAQRCAADEPRAERRRMLQQRERQALEHALALVPLRADHWANLGRCLEVHAREGLARRDAVLPCFDAALELDATNTAILADAARAAVALDDPVWARSYAERGLRLHADLGMLLGEQGAVCLAEGRPEEAEVWFARALGGRWPGHEDKADRVRGLLCLAHLHRGRAQAALDLAREVLSRDPGQVATRLLCALALERLGRRSEARQEYRKVLQARPDHVLARAGLARLGE